MSETPVTLDGPAVPRETAMAADSLCGVIERLQQSRQLMRDQMLELNTASAQVTWPSASAAAALTQRHPWACMLGAAAAGALLMWKRPVCFAVLRRAVHSGLLPQVLDTLMSQVPTERLMDFAQSLWQRSSPDELSPESAKHASLQSHRQPHGIATSDTLH